MPRLRLENRSASLHTRGRDGAGGSIQALYAMPSRLGGEKDDMGSETEAYALQAIFQQLYAAFLVSR